MATDGDPLVRVAVYRGTYFLVGSIWENVSLKKKKRLFFWADTAGLVKYCTGGYCRSLACSSIADLLLVSQV